MKAIFQSIQSIIKQILLVSGCLMLLSACGSSETAAKTDLLKIAKVFYDTNWTPDKQKAISERLQNAKSEDEVKQILAEMVAVFEPTSAKLDALDLQSPEVKAARDKLSEGLRGVVEHTKSFLKVDLQSDDGKVKALELQSKLLEAQKKLREGFQELSQVAAAQGVDLGKTTKENK